MDKAQGRLFCVVHCFLSIYAFVIKSYPHHNQFILLCSDLTCSSAVWPTVNNYTWGMPSTCPVLARKFPKFTTGSFYRLAVNCSSGLRLVDPSQCLQANATWLHIA